MAALWEPQVPAEYAARANSAPTLPLLGSDSTRPDVTVHQLMKNRYRLYRRRRGGNYYAHDAVTGKQESLKTTSRPAALRLIAAKNAATEHPQLNLALARTYLTVHDPKMLKRRWQEVMNLYASRRRDSTRDRSARAFESRAFDPRGDRRSGDDELGSLTTARRRRRQCSLARRRRFWRRLSCGNEHFSAVP